MNDTNFQFKTIAIVESPFKEKFGVPRQSGLAESARGTIIIKPEYAKMEAFKGLEESTHIWLLFVFHEHLQGDWSLSVRPPRLGGNEKVGVFATRSGHRPNPIGMSVVVLEEIIFAENEIRLNVSGIDLVDGTPVLDIKPYVPYVDALPEAENDLAPAAPDEVFCIDFTKEADSTLGDTDQGNELRSLLIESLSLDPRPAYKGDNDDKTYAMRLGDYDVKWRLNGAGRLLVENLEKVA